MNRKMNSILKTEDKDYVVLSDTDSIYLHMGPLVENVYKEEKTTEGVVAFLNKVCEKQLGAILSSYQELADYDALYDQKMIMKRNIADISIWTRREKIHLECMGQ